MSPCLNCGAALTGPFCANCGQKLPRSDPTLAEFLHDTTEELVHWDGKIPTTLKTLFLKPGQLTVDFMQGRRARWLLPLRLYLICSIAYFLTGPTVERLTHRQAKQALRFGVTMSDTLQLSDEDRAELDSSVVTRLIGKERMDRIVANPAAVQDEVTRSFPKAMFVLLPLFALLTNLVFRKAVPRYPAHLYFALHVHAAAFGALALAKLAQFAGLVPLDVAAGFAALFYIGWYGLRSCRVVFGGSLTSTAVKAVVVGAVYWAFIILATLALVVYSVATI